MIKYLGLHETLDVHELVTFKNLSVTKSATMSKLAQDPELKAILDTEAVTGTRHIRSLQQFLTKKRAHLTATAGTTQEQMLEEAYNAQEDQLK
jgi:similar to spore coat protein